MGSHALFFYLAHLYTEGIGGGGSLWSEGKKACAIRPRKRVLAVVSFPYVGGADLLEVPLNLVKPNLLHI